MQARIQALLGLRFNTLNKQTVALINMKLRHEKSKDGYKEMEREREEEEESRLREQKASIPDLVSQQFN